MWSLLSQRDAESYRILLCLSRWLIIQSWPCLVIYSLCVLKPLCVPIEFQQVVCCQSAKIERMASLIRPILFLSVRNSLLHAVLFHWSFPILFSTVKNILKGMIFRIRPSSTSWEDTKKAFESPLQLIKWLVMLPWRNVWTKCPLLFMSQQAVVSPSSAIDG